MFRLLKLFKPEYASIECARGCFTSRRSFYLDVVDANDGELFFRHGGFFSYETTSLRVIY